MEYILIDDKNTYIDKEVKIGANTIIHPFVFLKGSTIIGSNVEIKPFTTIIDSTIGDNSIIDSSNIKKSQVGINNQIGPMAHLRPGNIIGNNNKIGNFVEIKNSNIGDNVKASHLSYLGDVDLENNINIGCGVIFVNYDGTNKHRSLVKNGSFIGSNANIIAPITIEEDSYIAAGSTLTISTEKNDLVIARQRERIIKNWERPKKEGE